MAKAFKLDSARDKRFEGGPDEDAGVRLSRGYLPGRIHGGCLAYVHVDHIEDGQVVPSATDAIDSVTGRVLAPGDVVVIDVLQTPPAVVRQAGTFVLHDTGVQFQSNTGF